MISPQSIFPLSRWFFDGMTKVGGGVWGTGLGGGAAPAARQRRRSGRRPLKTARRAVWAAPYGLRFAAAGIGKYWRSGAAGMGIETIRANFFEIVCQKNGGSFVKSSGSRRNINAGKEGSYEVSTKFDRKLAGW